MSKKPKRTLAQQKADLERRIERERAHSTARALLDFIRSDLHGREYASARDRGELLLGHLCDLAAMASPQLNDATAADPLPGFEDAR